MELAIYKFYIWNMKWFYLFGIEQKRETRDADLYTDFAYLFFSATWSHCSSRVNIYLVTIIKRCFKTPIPHILKYLKIYHATFHFSIGQTQQKTPLMYVNSSTVYKMLQRVLSRCPLSKGLFYLILFISLRTASRTLVGFKQSVKSLQSCTSNYLLGNLAAGLLKLELRLFRISKGSKEWSTILSRTPKKC